MLKPNIPQPGQIWRTMDDPRILGLKEDMEYVYIRASSGKHLLCWLVHVEDGRVTIVRKAEIIKAFLIDNYEHYAAGNDLSKYDFYRADGTPATAADL